MCIVEWETLKRIEKQICTGGSGRRSFLHDSYVRNPRQQVSLSIYLHTICILHMMHGLQTAAVAAKLRLARCIISCQRQTTRCTAL